MTNVSYNHKDTLCKTQPTQTNGCRFNHRILLHLEGIAHIDFPKFETSEAINMKILPVILKESYTAWCKAMHVERMNSY